MEVPSLNKDLSELKTAEFKKKARIRLDLINAFLKEKEFKKAIDMLSEYLKNYGNWKNFKLSRDCYYF